MQYKDLNRKIILAGEALRSEYLYQIQDRKNLVEFLTITHYKKQLIKNKILKLIKC